MNGLINDGGITNSDVALSNPNVAQTHERELPNIHHEIIEPSDDDQYVE